MQLGVRGFNPKLRGAQGRLEALQKPPKGNRYAPNISVRPQTNCVSPSSGDEGHRRARLERIEAAPVAETDPMLLELARVVGICIETADMLVHEVLAPA